MSVEPVTHCPARLLLRSGCGGSAQRTARAASHAAETPLLDVTCTWATACNINSFCGPSLIRLQSSPQDPQGGYAKKWMVLNVVEAGGARKKEPIGRVVIDLAEFGNLDLDQVGEQG